MNIKTIKLGESEAFINQNVYGCPGGHGRSWEKETLRSMLVLVWHVDL